MLRSDQQVDRELDFLNKQIKMQKLEIEKLKYNVSYLMRKIKLLK